MTSAETMLQDTQLPGRSTASNDTETMAAQGNSARLVINQDWLKPDAAYGWRHTVVLFASLLAVVAAAPWLWLYVHPLTVLLVIPALGAIIYKFTILMHELSHRTLFPSAELNNKVGYVCGLLLGSDFDTFRTAHWQHHKAYGVPTDPQGRDYMGLQNASRARMIWHLLRPLLGYNLFKLASFNPVQDMVDQPITAAPRFKRLALVAGVQLALAALATGFGQVWLLLPLYPIAAATFGLFFSQIRGFCEHIAPAMGTDEKFVRSHKTNLFDRMFFYTLNFNYHVEHHLYPQLPCCHLPKLQHAMTEAGKAPLISPSIFSTIKERLAQCPR